jgi:hypothetical protein
MKRMSMNFGLDANNVRFRNSVNRSLLNVNSNANNAIPGRISQGRPSGFGASMFQRINVNTASGGGGCGCGK